MNIAIWIVLAIFCFVMPAVALSSGGSRTPSGEPLGRYAKAVGLPLTEEVARPVGERIRRRHRGMRIGALVGIVAATVSAILFLDNDSWAGVLVMVAAGVGGGLGGAWAIAVHHPAPTIDRPVVARTRSVRLADYLTPGERFGFWATPAVLLLGAAAGTLLLLRLPEEPRGSRVVLGLIGCGLVLLAWAAATLALRRVLAAPARSGSELELAWDDAERAEGLRQLVNLAVAAASFSLIVWLVLIAEGLTLNGFYREHVALSYALTGVALAVFIPLLVAQAGGSMWAWMSGSRKGYEQRRLWPRGVRLS